VRTSRTLSTSCAIAISLVGLSAHADGTDHDKAVAAFAQARKLVDAGDCATAINKLLESISLEPSVGARLTLADCYEPVNPLQAWVQVEEAARVAAQKHDVRADLADKRAVALAAKLPSIQIVVPASQEIPGLEVRIDGVPIDTFFYNRGPVATKPGPHIVEASAGPKKWSQSVDAEVGKPVSVTVDLQEAAPENPVPAVTPATPPPPPVPAPKAGGKRRTLGIAFGAVGLAGLGVGVAAGISAATKTSNLKTNCQGSLSPCRAPTNSLNSEKASATTASTVSTLGFMVGGVALATGIVLYLTAPKSSREVVAITPLLVRDGPGAAVVGSW
jgi:hypothetical protein